MTGLVYERLLIVSVAVEFNVELMADELTYMYL
jgi:hypothetical protein